MQQTLVDGKDLIDGSILCTFTVREVYLGVQHAEVGPVLVEGHLAELIGKIREIIGSLGLGLRGAGTGAMVLLHAMSLFRSSTSPSSMSVSSSSRSMFSLVPW